MATSRVTRARQTEELLARWFQARGWPEACRVPASVKGVDILNLPFAPEVKATTGTDFTGALRQARKNAGDKLPLVIYRPNGFGPERIHDWLAIFSLFDATQLLQGKYLKGEK